MLLLLALLTAGCLGGADETASTPTNAPNPSPTDQEADAARRDNTSHANRTDHTAGSTTPANARGLNRTRSQRPPLERPTFLAPVHLEGHGGIGAEPTITTAPNGSVYVESTGWLWRSDDGGRSYTPLGEAYCYPDARIPTCPDGLTAYDPGLDGEGDGDIAVDGDGTLYWTGHFGEDSSMPIPFQASEDGGVTFSEPTFLGNGSVDRQWLDARPDGTLYVTWLGQTVMMRRSFDGGGTWSNATSITPARVAGPPVHEPGADTVYLPYARDELYLARSEDHGRTWNHSLVAEIPDTAIEGPTGRLSIFPVAAVDQAGTVYIVWSLDPQESVPVQTRTTDAPQVFFAASIDEGRSFTDPIRLSPPGKTAIFPWIDAGKLGRVTVAWYENTLGGPNHLVPDRWNVHLVESVTADMPDPVFKGGLANDEPFHLGTICTMGFLCTASAQDRSMLDFFEVAIGEDGHPRVAWAADPDTVRGPVQVYAGGVEEGTPLR